MIRLGPKQKALLVAVCQSNGGGVNCYGLNERVFRSLEEKGLIQGKAGEQWRAVHTPLGLDYYRRKMGALGK